MKNKTYIFLCLEMERCVSVCIIVYINMSGKKYQNKKIYIGVHAITNISLVPLSHV
jgi:hypothetical protein